MTTIFIPMPEWQAISFLRNRDDAFRRLLTPLGNHLDTEVIMENDEVLVGFRNRDGAVQTGLATRPQGFTILRINLEPALQKQMAAHGEINGSHNHPQSGEPVWLLNRNGVGTVAQRAASGEVEVLMDQIFGPQVPESIGNTGGATVDPDDLDRLLSGPIFG